MKYRQKEIGNKGLTLIEVMILGAMVIIFAVLIVPSMRFISVMPNYSNGERTGVVVKLSKKGVLYKTWEGEMNIGSMSTDGNGVAVPTVFEFSVKDETIIPVIQSAAQSGKRITLIYEQALIRNFKEGDTAYLIVGVKHP